MALSEQFKRVMLALYESSQLRGLKEGERALAAAEIARSNLVKAGYLTESSMKRPLEQMQQTSKGHNGSREKRNDSEHGRKMRSFAKVWQTYQEAVAEKESTAPRQA